MEAIIETPSLLDRLFDVLRPQANGLRSQQVSEGPGHSMAKLDQASTRRSTAGQTTTRSVPASATVKRTQKGAARRNR
jgi:hypothetical protein